MEKIAARRFGTWIGDGWNDFWADWANYLPFGLVAYALFIIQVATPSLLNCTGVGQQAAAVIFNFVLSILLPAIAKCGLDGVALARLHGREATGEDFQQDLSVHAQAILGYLCSYILFLLCGVLSLIPGMALFIPGVAQQNNGLVSMGILLMIVFSLPTLLLVQAFTLYVIPLIVDKRYDFWTALMQSVDCCRRDVFGLLIFVFILYVALGLAAGIFALFTCSFGLILVQPLWRAIVMRSYRDYFGLDEDRFRPPQVAGYSTYGTPIASGWEHSSLGRGYEDTGEQAPAAPQAPLCARDLPTPPEGVMAPFALPATAAPPRVELRKDYDDFESDDDQNTDDDLPPPPPPAGADPEDRSADFMRD